MVQARKNADIELDRDTADIVADAMMKWAEGLGVTHFCHWFQPLSGVTAQKQDACGHSPPPSLVVISRVNGKTVSNFTGKKLIKGEPDASSFPNGGLRETHMARGFTVWDPNSNPIIVKHDNGGTLYIPSVFLSWKGDVLDQKIPFLRSQEVLIREADRLFRIIGYPQTNIDVNCGIEQEFFLIQREYYDKRPDLKLTGRTLFGCPAPKGQELHDQYFSEMTNKALNYIHDVEIEMWKLGIPTTTRHREVAPGQYELAPLYGESILATDQNLQSMDILRKQGRRHNLKALFHEKPFEGVNGSGKHNNWSLCSKETPTFLELGDHPEKNLPFIVSVAASIRAVDKYGDLLRACVTSASNDHRLGGNEAPPAIMSMYLGEDVTNALEMFMKKKTSCSSVGSTDLNLGVCSIPSINREGNDRNRTSPFAFTVNKFEFRAVGSNQSAARSNMVINTIMADSFRYIADEIIRHKQSSFMTDEEAIQKTVTDIITKHNRIIFNGNGYSPEWVSRAQELSSQQRGVARGHQGVDGPEEHRSVHLARRDERKRDQEQTVDPVGPVQQGHYGGGANHVRPVHGAHHPHGVQRPVPVQRLAVRRLRPPALVAQRRADSVHLVHVGGAERGDQGPEPPQEDDRRREGIEGRGAHFILLPR